MELPSFGFYGPGSDYNGRAVYFVVGPLTVYFSYNTVVAFGDETGLTVSENHWGTTTGKHLNAIDGGDKKARLPRDEFERRLKVALEKLEGK